MVVSFQLLNLFCIEYRFPHGLLPAYLPYSCLRSWLLSLYFWEALCMYPVCLCIGSIFHSMFYPSSLRSIGVFCKKSIFMNLASTRPVPTNTATPVGDSTEAEYHHGDIWVKILICREQLLLAHGHLSLVPDTFLWCHYRRASETFQVRWLIYGRRVGGRYSDLG